MLRTSTLLLLALLAAPAVAQQMPSASNTSYQNTPYQMVPRSDIANFSIRCFKGDQLIWGIYPRGTTSDNQVARQIYYQPKADGRMVLSFLRGFTTGEKQTTYVAAVDVNCEMAEQ
ncbi:hypothetical protein [Luteibacter aegosomatissinici]|uniref:hypothetical protein n=1 Tax=Luteibacter aegosomatissinici TaxID=2911539 RepID=UPI001FF828C0|nr:hypothetical protein [Luteibacter aegosomatissinici]UPG92806.1 hypothetical protein L2Y97_13120 [Luteibacter aegosomatissinici]